MSQGVIHLEQRNDAAKRIWSQTALGSALVAGGFTLTVAVVMLGSFVREQALNPLTVGDFEEYRQQLIKEPENEAVRQQFRQADQALRASYFKRRAFVHRGAYLLLAGAVIVVLGTKMAARYSARPYVPGPALPVSYWARMGGLARQGVMGFALISAGALAALAALPRYHPPAFTAMVAGKPGPAGVEVAPALPEPAAEMFQKNWPSFRGASGTGLVVGGEYPVAWDGPAGKNILWKVPVALQGNNSPIVWEDMVFLAGATEKQREVYCFDAGTGALRWKQPVSAPASAAALELLPDTSYAPNTLATDGRRVFALFPTMDLAAFDFAGKKLWQRNLGMPASADNAYGHASSLLAYKGRVIVLFDQGDKPSAGKSALLCFDGATGQPVWQVKRPVQVCWSTPILMQTPAGGQILTAGNPLAIAHDAETGAILWQAKCLDGEVAPSPVYANGIVYVANERADATAIKADGKGDVSESHVLWRSPDGLPDIVSPLTNGELLFMVITHGGLLTCVDTKTGKMVFEKEMEADFNASPALVGKNVYLLDMTGVMHIFEAGRAFKLVGKPALLPPPPADPPANGAEEEKEPEQFHASAAFAGNRIFIRSTKNLYCIGAKQ